MGTYIFSFFFIIAAFAFLAFALNFSKYKRDGGGGCCASGLEEFEKNSEACNTCPMNEKPVDIS
jgi:hypothetical protein